MYVTICRPTWEHVSETDNIVWKCLLDHVIEDIVALFYIIGIIPRNKSTKLVFVHNRTDPFYIISSKQRNYREYDCMKILTYQK